MAWQIITDQMVTTCNVTHIWQILKNNPVDYCKTKIKSLLFTGF